MDHRFSFDFAHSCLCVSDPLGKVGAAGNVPELILFGEALELSGRVLWPIAGDKYLGNSVPSKYTLQVNNHICCRGPIEFCDLDVPGVIVHCQQVYTWLPST